MLIPVTVSGAVGKQVYAAPSGKVEIEHVFLTPSAVNATITLRDGNASGEVVFFGRAHTSGGTRDFEICHKFNKGLHVKVIGTAAVAYLEIE
jgi:hypothetical protein